MSEAFLIDGELYHGESLAQAKATKKAIDDLSGKKLQQLIEKLSIADIAIFNRETYNLGELTNSTRLALVQFLGTCTYERYESGGHLVRARTGKLYTVKVLKTMEL